MGHHVLSMPFTLFWCSTHEPSGNLDETWVYPWIRNVHCWLVSRSQYPAFPNAVLRLHAIAITFNSFLIPFLIQSVVIRHFYVNHVTTSIWWAYRDYPIFDQVVSYRYASICSTYLFYKHHSFYRLLGVSPHLLSATWHVLRTTLFFMHPFLLCLEQHPFPDCILRFDFGSALSHIGSDALTILLQ